MEQRGPGGMSGIEDTLAGLPGARGDRRAFLRRAAGLGLTLPAIGALGREAARAQEGSAGPEATPAPGGYVGSDPGSPSTGAASPVPSREPRPFQPYDPFLRPVPAGPKAITVTAIDAVLSVARDVAYAGWTFDGTIPGRTLRVVAGDPIAVTFRVDAAASTAHSLDLHSARTPPDVNYKTILPGEELRWSFVPKYAGAYLYHCGTPPVLMHIGAGMYGAMVVDPPGGWSPAQELILVQSDVYVKDGGGGVRVPDYAKMLGGGPMDYVVFNGYAHQYVEHPIRLRVGEPVRIFVVNAGPNVWSSFHVVGAIFDRAYVNANPTNPLTGVQSITIGPGDGACVELVFDEPGEYPAVNHAFGHAAHGAVALLVAE